MSSRWARWGAALPFLLLVLWVTLFWNGPLINDAAWQLWIGARMNAGARLYSDILEINPPLWFWIGAGVDAVAGALGIGAIMVLHLFFAAAALLSLLLIRALPLASRDRSAAGVALIATLLLSSPFAHLQREQFLWITAAPLVLLYVARAEKAAVPLGVALAIGAVSATGLALKHYFLLLPLLLELWLLSRLRTWRLRPELIVLACTGAAYVASVLLITPDYLSTMLPLIRLAYGAYDQPAYYLLSQPGLLVALLAVIAFLLARTQRRPATEAAAVAAIALAAAFVWQTKNFHYQAIPALGGGLLTASLLLAGRPAREWTQEGGAAALAALAAAVATPLVAGPARYDQVFASATAELRPGDPVMALTSSAALAWPSVGERSLAYPSRFMGFWMLPTAWIAKGNGAGDVFAMKIAGQVRREVAAEIGCSRPKLIVVDGRYDEFVPGGNTLAWFLAEPALHGAMASYQEISPTAYLRRFRIRDGAAQNCDRRALHAVQPARP